MPTRSRFIDVAKGTNILLVAFGHSHLIYTHAWVASANQSLLLFRMPFFFFLSGIFFEERKTFREMLLEKADALLKPYWVTLLLVLLKRQVFDDAPLRQEALRMLYGVGATIRDPWAPLWYLPHLWVLFLFSLALMRATGFADRQRAQQVGVLALLLVGGILGVRYSSAHPVHSGGMLASFAGLPFSLDLVLLSAAFFLLGRAMRTEAIRFQPRWGWVVGLLGLFLALKGGAGPRLDMNLRIYAQLLATTLCAFAGIYLALSASYVLDRIPAAGRLLSAIGSLSLFILLFQACIERIAYEQLPRWLGYGPGKLVSLLAYALSVGIPILIGVLVRQSEWASLLYLPLKGGHALRNMGSTSEEAPVPLWASRVPRQ